MDDSGVAGGQGRSAGEVIAGALICVAAAALVAGAWSLGAWLGYEAVAR